MALERVPSTAFVHCTPPSTGTPEFSAAVYGNEIKACCLAGEHRSVVVSATIPDGCAEELREIFKEAYQKRVSVDSLASAFARRGFMLEPPTYDELKGIFRSRIEVAVC